MIVCLCHAVRDRELDSAIADGADDPGSARLRTVEGPARLRTSAGPSRLGPAEVSVSCGGRAMSRPSVVGPVTAAARAAGIPIPYAGFNGTVAQALRKYPQYQNIDWRGLPLGAAAAESLGFGPALVDRRVIDDRHGRPNSSPGRKLTDGKMRGGRSLAGSRCGTLMLTPPILPPPAPEPAPLPAAPEHLAIVTDDDGARGPGET